MVGELSPWHLLIVAIVFIVLFGSKKLPDASRSLGRSLRIFKSEVSSMKDEFKAEAQPQPAQPAAIPPVQDTPLVQDTPPAQPAAAEPAKAEQPKA
jgi:sec-independent protein translocase protein TatA